MAGAADCIKRTSDNGFILGNYSNDICLTKLIRLERFTGHKYFGASAPAEREPQVEETNDGGFIAVGWANPGYLLA